MSTGPRAWSVGPLHQSCVWCPLQGSGNHSSLSWDFIGSDDCSWNFLRSDSVPDLRCADAHLRCASDSDAVANILP